MRVQLGAGAAVDIVMLAVSSIGMPADAVTVELLQDRGLDVVWP
ncbi:hypothetical protein ACFQZZ_13330 [Nocardia sp. GCM10030253]